MVLHLRDVSQVDYRNIDLLITLMTTIFQILALAALGLITVEIALFAAINSGAWWLIAIGAILAYVGFLSGIFLGDSEWVPGLFKTAYRTAFSSNIAGFLTAIVSVVMASIGGAHLHSIWPKNELRILVFESSYHAEDRKAGVEVFVGGIAEAGPLSSKITNSEGMAVFPAKVGDNLLVSVRTQRSGSVQFGAVPPHRIEEVPDYLSIKLNEIPRDAWRTAEQAGPPVSDVALLDMAQGSASDPGSQSIIVDDVDSKKHAPWGIPGAKLILNRTAYSLGYDTDTKIPSWVAHQVLSPDPNYRRPKIRFGPDPDIPQNDQASEADYRGSGYHRGSFLSGMDISSLGEDAVKTVFYLSAAAPQTPAANTRTWFRLEQYTRDVVESSGHVIYAISGPAFVTNGMLATKFIAIGESHVAVPTHYFRILARANEGAAPDVLAFMIPNEMNVASKFSDYRVSVAMIEALTGLRFFDDLPAQQRNLLIKDMTGQLWEAS